MGLVASRAPHRQCAGTTRSLCHHHASRSFKGTGAVAQSLWHRHRRVCQGGSLWCPLIFAVNTKRFSQVFQHQVRVDTVLLVKSDVGEPRLAAPSGPPRCPLPQSSRFTLARSLRDRGRRQLPRGPRPLCHTLPTHSSADMEGPPRDTETSGQTGWISSQSKGLSSLLHTTAHGSAEQTPAGVEGAGSEPPGNRGPGGGCNDRAVLTGAPASLPALWFSPTIRNRGSKDETEASTAACSQTTTDGSSHPGVHAASLPGRPIPGDLL